MANVNFKRGDTATMNATAISDGLIFLNTENNKIYFDNGSTRLQFGGDTSLISSVDDADVDNAFNASATVNLFVQKNSIVDTKANALAVTQPQIPLGCLAFKEAVGTTDISTIGGGTLSGAISTLNSGKINTSAIANNLTTTASGYVLDARQGKALNDKITKNVTVGSMVSLTNNVEYVASTDGYLFIHGEAGYGAYADLWKGAIYYAQIHAYNQTNGMSNSLFVRKGVVIKAHFDSSTGSSAYFTPIT